MRAFCGRVPSGRAMWQSPPGALRAGAAWKMFVVAFGWGTNTSCASGVSAPQAIASQSSGDALPYPPSRQKSPRRGAPRTPRAPLLGEGSAAPCGARLLKAGASCVGLAAEEAALPA